MNGAMRSAALILGAALVAGTAGGARADQVIVDDLIVDGSICVGIPCANGEDFGFDTAILKGDVVRLHFLDTSTSAAFPSGDWRIVVNDADGAGAAERFSIEDASAARTPFTIEGGTPSHALYVGATGVGIGTPAPAAGTALDVNGNLRVDGDLDVTGAVTGPVGVKAGIIPAAAFAGGLARVDFAAPYAGDYVVLLTPVSTRPSVTFRPAVIMRDPTGFTVSRGGDRVRRLVEVHWMTQPVGE